MNESVTFKDPNSPITFLVRKVPAISSNQCAGFCQNRTWRLKNTSTCKLECGNHVFGRVSFRNHRHVGDCFRSSKYTNEHRCNGEYAGTSSAALPTAPVQSIATEVHIDKKKIFHVKFI